MLCAANLPPLIWHSMAFGDSACRGCFAVLWLQLGQTWEGETLVLLQHSVSWWVPPKTPSQYPLEEGSGRAWVRLKNSENPKKRNIKKCRLVSEVLCVLPVDLSYRHSSSIYLRSLLTQHALKFFQLRWISELCYLIQSHRVQCSLNSLWKRLLYIFNIFVHVFTEIKYVSQHSIC